MRAATGVPSVGVLWSAVASVRSGRRTVRPARRRPSNACGLVTSCTRCRSMYSRPSARPRAPPRSSRTASSASLAPSQAEPRLTARKAASSPVWVLEVVRQVGVEGHAVARCQLVALSVAHQHHRAALDERRLAAARLVHRRIVHGARRAARRERVPRELRALARLRRRSAPRSCARACGCLRAGAHSPARPSPRRPRPGAAAATDAAPGPPRCARRPSASGSSRRARPARASARSRRCARPARAGTVPPRRAAPSRARRSSRARPLPPGSARASRRRARDRCSPLSSASYKCTLSQTVGVKIVYARVLWQPPRVIRWRLLLPSNAGHRFKLQGRRGWPATSRGG